MSSENNSTDNATDNATDNSTAQSKASDLSKASHTSHNRALQSFVEPEKKIEPEKKVLKGNPLLDKLANFYDVSLNQTLSTELDITGVELTSFSVKLNDNIMLSNILKGLTQLYCADNLITTLPSPETLPQLTILDCRYNPLTTIPSYKLLTELNCGHCKLSTINDLPELNIIDCSSNFLSKLPVFLKVTKLYCSHNQLNTLEHYPTLKECYCEHNLISKISDLPKLEKLDCSYNKLQHLPILPSVRILNICDNKIRSLNNRTIPLATSVIASYHYLLQLSETLAKRIKYFKYNISAIKYEQLYNKFISKLGLSELEKRVQNESAGLSTIFNSGISHFFEVIQRCFKECFILDIDIMSPQLADYLYTFEKEHSQYGTSIKSVKKNDLIKFIKDVYLRLVQIEIVL